MDTFLDYSIKKNATVLSDSKEENIEGEKLITALRFVSLNEIKYILIECKKNFANILNVYHFPFEHIKVPTPPPELRN